MTILETFIQLRDDLKIWVTNNLNTKADKTKVEEVEANVSQKIQMITWEEND